MNYLKLLIAFSALLILAVPAQAEVTIHEKFPWNMEVFVPCANDGNGEFVVAEGLMHLKIREEMDSSGGYHWGFHAQPMGAKGVGAITGDVYRVVGATLEMYNENFPGCPSVHSFVNNFRFIGPGKGNNFQLHRNTHTVLDADCNVTVAQDNFTGIQCF